MSGRGKRGQRRRQPPRSFELMEKLDRFEIKEVEVSKIKYRENFNVNRKEESTPTELAEELAEFNRKLESKPMEKAEAAAGKLNDSSKTSKKKKKATAAKELKAASKVNKAMAGKENKAMGAKENEAMAAKENKATEAKENKATAAEVNEAMAAKENKVMESKEKKAEKKYRFYKFGSLGPSLRIRKMSNYSSSDSDDPEGQIVAPPLVRRDREPFSLPFAGSDPSEYQVWMRRANSSLEHYIRNHGKDGEKVEDYEVLEVDYDEGSIVRRCVAYILYFKAKNLKSAGVDNDDDAIQYFCANYLIFDGISNQPEEVGHCMKFPRNRMMNMPIDRSDSGWWHATR